MAKFSPSIWKIKALMLITPEHANELDIPAEAPVFVSPYILTGRCPTCRTTYTPLVYNIGHITEAQHFCRDYGGLYVRTLEDTSGKWIYSDNLWHALSIARGPIRMGEDKGFTFKTVEPKKFLQPMCYQCGKPCTNGVIYTDLYSLIPICQSCEDHHDLPRADHHTLTPWSFVWDGTEVRFRRHMPIPSYAGIQATQESLR